MGAERQASALAISQGPTSVKPTDSTAISAEASALGAVATDGSARTTRILTGLEQSFQGNSQDRNGQKHRPKQQY